MAYFTETRRQTTRNRWLAQQIKACKDLLADSKLLADNRALVQHLLDDYMQDVIELHIRNDDGDGRCC